MFFLCVFKGHCFLGASNDIFFSMRYSRMLEESSFHGRRADYFWLLLQSAVMLLVSVHSSHIWVNLYSSLLQGISPLVNMPFLSSPLAFVPIYMWSRRNPITQISLFGIVTITAPYLPLALVAFSWFLNGTWRAAAGDLLGCAVGHVVWFIRDVWPREMMGSQGIWSDAPEGL